MHAETTGVDPKEHKLIFIHLCDPFKEIVSIIKMPNEDSINLKQLLSNSSLVKLFHNARFDSGFIYKNLGMITSPVICIRLMSKMTNNTDNHSLKNLVNTLLGLELSNDIFVRLNNYESELTQEYLNSAALHVIYLNDIKNKIFETANLQQLELADKCFEIIPLLAAADCNGLNLYGAKIFDH